MMQVAIVIGCFERGVEVVLYPNLSARFAHEEAQERWEAEGRQPQESVVYERVFHSEEPLEITIPTGKSAEKGSFYALASLPRRRASVGSTTDA